MKELDYTKGFDLTSRSLRLTLFSSEETGVVSENSRYGIVKSLDFEYQFFSGYDGTDHKQRGAHTGTIVFSIVKEMECYIIVNFFLPLFLHQFIIRSHVPAPFCPPSRPPRPFYNYPESTETAVRVTRKLRKHL